jgi:hypothetical protein
MSQPTGDEPIKPGEEIFMTSVNLDDMISRTADFLHGHGPFTNQDPETLPAEVTNSILHLAEHFLRYIGVTPGTAPFYTPHLEWCDDDYYAFMDLRAEMKELGVPDGLTVEEQVRYMQGVVKDMKWDDE